MVWNITVIETVCHNSYTVVSAENESRVRDALRALFVHLHMHTLGRAASVIDVADHSFCRCLEARRSGNIGILKSTATYFDGHSSG